MDHRFIPDNNIPPPPPFVPGRGNPAMEQPPHDYHVVEPPLHAPSNIPNPGYRDNHHVPLGSSNHLVILEGYTISREQPTSRGEKATWAVARRTQWKAGQNDLKELVKKQQKRRVSAYIPLNAHSEIKSRKREQVERLVEDRNSHGMNDARTKYEVAAIKLEQFQTRNTGMDEKLKVILRRRVRPNVAIHPTRPILAPPPIEPKEIIHLTISEDYEGSSQQSYPPTPPHLPGQGAFPFPFMAHPGAHPTAHPAPQVHQARHFQPEIVEERFPPQQFDQPLGEEQHLPTNHAHMGNGHEPKHFGSFASKERGLKEDNSKDKHRQEEEFDSASTTGSDESSLQSASTPLTSNASVRSSFNGDKRNFHRSPQRQSSIRGHGDRDHDFKEEKAHKESYRPETSGHDHETRGRGFKEKAHHHDVNKARSRSSDHSHEHRGHGFKDDKAYRHDRSGPSGRDREYQRGGSREVRGESPAEQQRRSGSLDRHSRGRHDKQEKRYDQAEYRHNFHSHEGSEDGRSYRSEKSYHPVSYSSRVNSHNRGRRPIATREHVRKEPVTRSRGTLSEASRSHFTDDDTVVIPQISSRRRHGVSRSVVGDDRELFAYDVRVPGRHSNYRPKLTNKPLHHVDLHDDRFDYAREPWEVQRQRELDLAREEEEDRIVEREVQQHLAREDEEIRHRNQIRNEKAREDSKRRIAIKVREELERARAKKERLYDTYEPSMPSRRWRGAELL